MTEQDEVMTSGGTLPGMLEEPYMSVGQGTSLRNMLYQSNTVAGELRSRENSEISCSVQSKRTAGVPRNDSYTQGNPESFRKFSKNASSNYAVEKNVSL